jgi:hypothetical protein
MRHHLEDFSLIYRDGTDENKSRKLVLSAIIVIFIGYSCSNAVTLQLC